MSDEEQVEKLREWWQEHGRAVIAGIIIAVGGVIGWQQWGAYQDRQAEAASATYMQFVEARDTGADADTVVRRGQRVLDDFGSSTYAAMAGMQLATYQAQQDAADDAVDTLQWVIDNAADKPFRDLARLRLAQIHYGHDRLDDALAVLEDAEDGPYEGRYEELRGDIHAARGDREEARTAYRNALDADAVSGMRRTLIELKLNEMGGEASA
ncbi:YfgM family protein [Aquisalimonas asiatica]|uniref:Ancillary SecYEG translocon subunit n=1 Tax=Aquisalimonas asiatica TaxID=406100 RepID=A0A1H8PN87_9GAMM|nr:tetratricopeptide repeat protein [Aquisalimonas asiatica]SEO43144.1 Putative negative regulator of RcsB-dependent stress response [Aquisalimonas asiatica]